MYGLKSFLKEHSDFYTTCYFTRYFMQQLCNSNIELWNISWEYRFLKQESSCWKDSNPLCVIALQIYILCALLVQSANLRVIKFNANFVPIWHSLCAKYPGQRCISRHDKTLSTYLHGFEWDQKANWTKILRCYWVIWTISFSMYLPLFKNFHTILKMFTSSRCRKTVNLLGTYFLS